MVSIAGWPKIVGTLWSNPMTDELRWQIVNLLNRHRIMTLATNRPDGWPQATAVGYWSDGLIIYCIIARDGQKYANLTADPRVSIAIANDDPDPLMIKGLSLAGRAVVIEEPSEFAPVLTVLLRRYPESRVTGPPDPAAMRLVQITPEIVSVLDYSRGFGHTELIRVTASDLAQFITESRRYRCGNYAIH
jgi:nitroimidazol reductase NimA-like FMN-containing flavoprotein (pyridoxamine 5'-phosphate oxidase superfamily)